MKAEDRALEAYPKETRDISGFIVDIGHPQYMRDLYIEGYHQAEKDFELTWEDVSLLRSILFDVEHEGFTKFPYEEFCKEVLKRFKETKGEKIIDGILGYKARNYFHSEDDYKWNTLYEAIDWLNAHHFDYRGLIEKGLALEAPEDMYKLNEK